MTPELNYDDLLNTLTVVDSFITYYATLVYEEGGSWAEFRQSTATFYNVQVEDICFYLTNEFNFRFSPDEDNGGFNPVGAAALSVVVDPWVDLEIEMVINFVGDILSSHCLEMTYLINDLRTALG